MSLRARLLKVTTEVLAERGVAAVSMRASTNSTVQVEIDVGAAAKFRAFTGLAPRASETGQTDRNGQPISKAGNRLLRTTLHRAADHARRVDPQLARLSTPRWWSAAKTTSGAVCVVAAHLAERAWAVMDRGMPYVICDTDGTQ